jgi:hypothetical protein
MKTLNSFLGESILDPIQETLSPELWKNEKMKASVKSIIIKRLELWLKTKTNKPIKKILMLGSMAGYQFTSQSDIDVNFVIDVSDEKRDEIAGDMAEELNGRKLQGTEHPINYYISNTFKSEWKGQALYDVIKDTWIQKPEAQEQGTIITNFRAVSEIARFFIAGVDMVLSEYQSDVAAYESYVSALKSLKKEEDIADVKKLINFKLQEIVADIDGIYIAKHMLRALRVEAFEKGESLEIHTKIDIRDKMDNSINNLIYKYVEKLGYFEKMTEIIDKADFWKGKL